MFSFTGELHVHTGIYKSKVHANNHFSRTYVDLEVEPNDGDWFCKLCSCIENVKLIDQN